MDWLRFIRDLPFGFKLGMTTASALAVLAAVSWLALDRLAFVTSLQAGVTAQATVEHQVQSSLIAVQEPRVASWESQVQQTIPGVRSAAVEQQAAATQSIAQAVRHAAAGTPGVNSNIAAFIQAVEETGDRAGGVLGAATAMTKQAAVLQTEVGKFLLAVRQAP